MQKKPFLQNILVVWIALAGLVLIAISFQSFESLKNIADRLVADGDFNSLKESNALVIKILLGAAGLFLGVLASLLYLNYFQKVPEGLREFSSDASFFLTRLKLPRKEWKYLACLALIILIGAILRWMHLNDPMTHDESYSFIVFASTSFFNIISNYHLPNNHVFHTLLVSLSTNFFGIQPWAIRLPAFLAGLLVIPASYGLTRSIYDRYTALASALLVAIFYGPIYYASTGRGYSLVSLFTVLMLWLAMFVIQEKNRFAWMLLILFATLGFYTVPVMLYPFGIVYGWLILENLSGKVGSGVSRRAYRSKMEFTQYWLVSGFSTALLVLLFYTPIFIYSGVDTVFSNQWVSPTTWDAFIGSTPTHLGNTWKEWFLGESIWIPILLAVGFVGSIFLHRRISRYRFPLQLAAIGWIIALLVIQRAHTGPKIFSFLQAPFLMWAAAGYFALIKDVRFKNTTRVSMPAIAVTILLMLGLARGVQAVREIPVSWSLKGPTENAVLYLKERLAFQDLVIVDSPYDASIWYYSRLHGLPENLFNKDLPSNRFWVIVAPNNEKSLTTVLQDRGPAKALINDQQASLVWNTGNLDIYEVPGR